MKTGKVEYTPDYKSKSQVKRIAARQGNILTRTDALIKKINERALLEREVIDAANKWDEAQGDYSDARKVDSTQPSVSGAWRRLRRAVKALREFE